MTVKHAFTSTAPEGADTSRVRTSNWNDGHTADNGEFAQTGDFKFAMRASAPTGWVAGNGGTIGSASSGATRANDDTQALFTLWWTDFNDATLPILTSAGSASTRGASAAADWAANKRLTVFDVRDRVPRAAGTTQVNGAKLEPTEVFDHFSTGASGSQIIPYISSSTNNTDGTSTKTMVYNLGAATASQTAAALNMQKVRVASIGMLGCFKL